MRPGAYLLCISLWGASAPATSEPRDLGLDDAVSAALSSHPVLRQAAIDIETAELRVRQARSSRKPQIDAGGLAKRGLSGSATLFNIHGLAASPEPEDMAFSGNVLQDLLDFRRSRFESEARQAEVEHFDETLRAERARLALEVRKQFYGALKAARKLALAREVVEERELALRQAESRQKSGLGSILDASMAAVAVERTRLARAKAADSLEQELAGLREAMGDEADQAYDLREPAISPGPPGPLGALLEESLESRAELAAVEARIRAAEAWAGRAERERYPRIMFMFSGGWTRFAELTLGRLLFGGFAIQLPVFTGGRLEASIEETRRVADKTRAVRDELARAVQRQVAESRSRVVAALASVRTAEEAVGPARRAEKLAGSRHGNGLADLLELAVARRVRAAAETDRDVARYEFQSAEAELDFAVGKRIGD